MVGIVGEAEQFLRQTFYVGPKAWIVEARERMRDLPKTNYDLGCRFADAGQWYDAMFRFRIVLYLNPEYPGARYNLGCCYYNLGKPEKAKAELLRVLRKEPAHTDAIFMLGAIDPSALSQEQRPQTMPAELVIRFFESVAAEYNQAEARNQYRGGKVVAEQVKPLLAGPEITVVDLGCGTGIASIPYRGAGAHLIGVDMTPAMVRQARAVAQGDAPLFEQVIEADVTAPLDMLPAEGADLALLVNVVQFVGRLEACFTQAARLLKPGGLLAVTVEPYRQSEGFGIMADTGRFGHSAAYVRQQAAAAGFVPAKQATIPFYGEMKVELLIFRKGAA